MKKFNLILFIVMSINLSWAQITNSILSNGTWYKISTNQKGIYKITYNDLISIGVNVSAINPKNIRLYGNGAGMLPEINSQTRPDDLFEIPIKVIGESDNIFDVNDYILFYGQASTKWNVRQDNSGFEHKINYYTDSVYYFLNTDIGLGKRIETRQSLTDTPNYYVSTFDDFICHENDLCNLIKSGKYWVGEKFDSLLTYNFSYYLKNLDTLNPVNIYAKVIARSGVASSYSLIANSQNILNISVTPVPLYSASGNYANFSIGMVNYSQLSDTLNVSIMYNIGDSTSIGWLDYFELNFRRKLILDSSQLIFRDKISYGIGNVSKFTILNTPILTEVWDITNPLNIVEQITSIQGANREFIVNTDTLKEFIAFDNTFFISPQFIKQVANQNLHGLSNSNLIIVTNPLFVNEALQLANHHINFDNLSVQTVTTEQIYNEFSTGAQDISAIRDFIRLMYQKSNGTTDSLTYVLLFGDASYDYKNKIENNTNYVPTFETGASFSEISSIASDDFYTMLDSLEGNELNGVMDIGVGRLPVKTSIEAQNVVNKIIHYSVNPNSFNNWRTDLCFIADDEDSNEHIAQTNSITNKIDTSYNCYNINKIYLDNYIEVNDSSGSSYPSVNNAITNQFNNGALVVNYVGHGSETKLANEGIITQSLIQNLSNYNNLPFFYGATASFGKYDKPEITSGGESFILNSNSGCIGLFSSGRLTYSSSNFTLLQNFYNYLFERNANGEHFRIGDIIKMAKNATSNSNDLNKRSYVLIGDPAVKLSYPEYSVVTTHINGISVQNQLDTIYSGDTLTINGFIEDNTGSIINDFNGNIYYRFYNVGIMDTTLGNNGGTPFVFYRQDSILIQGSDNVINGDFQIQFVVTQNGISTYGSPKLSLYATNNIIDAMGCFDDVIINTSLTGVSEIITNDMQINIFPTITSDKLFIQMSYNKINDINISIFDLTGRSVYSKNVENSITSIDVTNLEKGLYIINFANQNVICSRKFIKR